MRKSMIKVRSTRQVFPSQITEQYQPGIKKNAHPYAELPSRDPAAALLFFIKVKLVFPGVSVRQGVGRRA